jgi:nucleotide-binding universal stress UspA family protein
MMNIKKVLCPTDFSACADHALKYGLELARAFSATVYLHHSLDVPHLLPGFRVGFGMALDVSDERQKVEKAAKDMLARRGRELAEDAAEAGIMLQTRFTVGEPGRTIVALAVEERMDLIVVATHGRGAVKHLLLGSVAERVVRGAPCPVLTVKHPEHEFVRP